MKSIFKEAEGIVKGARQKAYGPPERNLEKIAALWSIYLEREVSARDVTWMMVLLKAGRDTHSRQRDNLVDAVGYLGLNDFLN